MSLKELLADKSGLTVYSKVYLAVSGRNRTYRIIRNK